MEYSNFTNIIVRITRFGITVILRTAKENFIIFAFRFFILNIRLNYYIILRNYISNLFTA